MSMPTRVDSELFEAARTTGSIQSRSAAQQIAHWARIGRELEASANVRHQDVARVLSGQDPYDGLGEREQAVVRAEWDARVTARLSTLDLAAEFAAAGDTWSELDDSGEVISRGRTAAS